MGNNPCEEYLVGKHLVTVQKGKVVDDVCTMLVAKNLVLSYSTFSLSLAWLADPTAKFFSHTPGMLMAHSNQQDLPETAKIQFGSPPSRTACYNVPGWRKSRHNRTFNKKWMLSFPVSSITGAVECERRKL